MRILNTEQLIPVIAELVQKAACVLDDDYLAAVRSALAREESPYGKTALNLILENAELARTEQLPSCQDTGSCLVFMTIGQELAWEGPALDVAVDEGVRRGYTDGYLRKSIVRDPFDRVNTGDNTPALLHTELVPGDHVKITVMLKGGGSENMGAFSTLLPQAGVEGVCTFVLETVRRAGGNPCPPVILGIGLGGTMDMCCLLAKKALLRPVGSRHSMPFYAALEHDLLEKINKLGIGPLGMGGRITALDVHIEPFPCHITALPVAVQFQCHAARSAHAEL
ncbi:MAG: fumarate hydratase [Spirochaetaceae bacterium]|nr:fumarate hydratase [Spirochaetaceae bacterium]